MVHNGRREFLTQVGQGMFLASIGSALASDLGLGRAWAEDTSDHLTFGELDPLVNFIHETSPDQLVPKVIAKLKAGTDLKQLVAAASLANARAFGGEDYVGFHTLMALAPAYHMSVEEKDPAKKPLAVLKVLYRNATRLSEMGQTKAEVLRPVRPSIEDNGLNKSNLRDLVRQSDTAAAERLFASQCQGTPVDALDHLMEMVDDTTEVHRVVLVSRAWELLDFVGKDKAHTMLRQSVRYCTKAERNGNNANYSREVRAVLPKLLDQYKLEAKPLGDRSMDDAWVESFAETIFRSTPSQAAEAAAGALAEGIQAHAIGQAVAVAANQLTLRDNGRKVGQTSTNKGVGSCHGDSIGVHACDSAHAWRTIAKAGGRGTTASSLILACYQIARDRGSSGEFFTWQPYPRVEHVEKIRDLAPEKLLGELGGAIRENDQGRAAAIASRVSEKQVAEAFALLREFAISEDGALHAEKYYRTTSAEYADARPAHRLRQLVALARVSASAFGQPAPGVGEAKTLLKV